MTATVSGQEKGRESVLGVDTRRVTDVPLPDQKINHREPISRPEQPTKGHPFMTTGSAGHCNQIEDSEVREKLPFKNNVKVDGGNLITLP